jgi:predicted nucleotidyltransferase component of viral defense system
MSKGDSNKAQIIIRNYVMERFLERVSLSPYRENLILKGGTLVSAMVGLNNRSTMDIDATIKNLSLTVENARKIVEEVTSIRLEDRMEFEIIRAETIMNDDEYSGVRVMMDATLETMHTPLQIDFSTGDVITPGEVEYSFRLMFEERTISILAYNMETVLAEKLETMITRGTLNTRMRDFYDIYALTTTELLKIDPTILRDAFFNTSKKRGSTLVVSDAARILIEVGVSNEMISLWEKYQRKYDYAFDINWSEVIKSVKTLYGIIKTDVS